MKTTDLEIFIENSLRNVKTGKWTIEQGKEFILEKINKFFGDLNEKLGNSLDGK